MCSKIYSSCSPPQEASPSECVSASFKATELAFQATTCTPINYMNFIVMLKVYETLNSSTMAITSPSGGNKYLEMRCNLAAEIHADVHL